jgi:hypothetical protein
MVTGSGKLPGEAGDPSGEAGRPGGTADAPDLDVEAAPDAADSEPPARAEVIESDVGGALPVVSPVTADRPDSGSSSNSRSFNGNSSNGRSINGNGNGANGTAAKQPSLVAGMTMLGLAGVLMVVVLINPPMPDWLRVVIVVVALVTVGALLVYAMLLFRTTKRGGGRG